jgi:flagellin
MHHYNPIDTSNVNGVPSSGQTYLDRVLAHELTHAVMAANINNFKDLPAYIKEGMAEVVHGIDDQRTQSILKMVDPANADDMMTMLKTGKPDDDSAPRVGGVSTSSYAGGYVLLRYMAKQSVGGGGGFTSGPDGDNYTFNYRLTDKAFTFQVGTKANQAIRMGFADMRAKALKLENNKQERISVTTRENAVKAMEVLDYALAKALDQQTTIGAMQSRLEHTINTLTIASESVQQSESTIRDADMAKEMTEYTKHNVLMQMAQAMLAQSNQSSSSVLSLLQ